MYAGWRYMGGKWSHLNEPSRLLTSYCWHTALTSNTTNISSALSQTRGNVPQRNADTHTHEHLCVHEKNPWDTHVCQHTNPYPALTSRRRETNTQTCIITQAQEWETGKTKCTGGQQTDGQCPWSSFTRLLLSLLINYFLESTSEL